MALETAQYINGLNASNPPSGDPIANSADHLRLIKSAVKATFPNISSPVTPTHQQLNSNLVPVGGIIMWSGTINSIPTGWGLCDGTVYTRLDGQGNLTSPNLKDRFIVGAGSTYGIGAIGGSATHSHTVTVAGTALTVDQLPTFIIDITDPGHIHSVTDPGHVHGSSLGTGFYSVGGGAMGWAAGSAQYNIGSPANTASAATGISIQSHTTGITATPRGTQGNTHSHSATTDSPSNLPPYYALAFIIKY